MAIDYNHSQNQHSLEGPKAALPKLFPDGVPASLLDVGCGQGTWLRAALDSGAGDVFGVDGVDIPAKDLRFDPNRFKKCDLTAPINLNRTFEAALCLEVAEHLDAAFAPVLVRTITSHSDVVVFSAACPNQRGQHHVNCQWPEYWQKLFNERGFSCSDDVRWRIWDDTRIEPWYRQNIFIARRSGNLAGREPRIKAIMHPEMLSCLITPENEVFESHVQQIENGRMSGFWYLKLPALALSQKVRRRFR
jgi:SAM-dependent methyltransferase